MNNFFFCVFIAWGLFSLAVVAVSLYEFRQSCKQRAEADRIAKRDLTLRMVENGSAK